MAAGFNAAGRPRAFFITQHRMKVIHNRLLPPGRNYSAINLFGVLFVKNGTAVTPLLLNHEAIHTAQMRELWYLPFYLLYIMEWLWRLAECRGNSYKAYRSISFEREAYSCAGNPGYLSERHSFAQYRKPRRK